MVQNESWYLFQFKEELFQGIPEGSGLGPLLFHIYENNLLYLSEDITTVSFAKDTTFNQKPPPEVFFNKTAALRPATLLKMETLAQVLSCEFCKISESAFFTEHLRKTTSV